MTSGAAALLGSDTQSRLAKRGSTPALVLEFFLVGGATLLLLPLLHWVRLRAGLDDSEFVVGLLTFHAAHVINNPHFAVTYLLFYRNAKERAFAESFPRLQRLRYLASGLLVPLVLVVWLGRALSDHSARELGLLIQLMFFLVGWHYVKQGFGVLSVLSLRRGVRFSPLERRLILLHCFAGWLFGRTNPPDPGRESVVDDVLYTSLPHPAGLDTLTGLAFGLSAVLLVWVLARKWRRERRLPPLSALCGLLVTVWLWTAYSRIDPLLAYVIPALHSLQYLYFVWLLKTNEAKDRAGPPAFQSVGRTLLLLSASAVGLGFVLLRGVPALLDQHLVLIDPIDRLGTTPYLAAFGAFVNIHHYFMDSVIWRRENPETRYLVAGAPADA